MNQPFEFTVREAGRLDQLLQRSLPEGLSRSRIRSLVLGGHVRVGGRVVRRPAWEPGPGARIAVSLPARVESPEVVVGASRILYEDEDLLVVDKPAGLAMHANLDPGRPHLVGLLEALLRDRDGAPGYLGIHQRLDRDTSGVVLLARSLRANPGLARQFEGRTVRKTYHALAVRPPGPLPRAWVERRPLGAPLRRGGAVAVLRTGGSPAETEFEVLQAAAGGLLVQARPRTGRKHQVRAHLAASGMPLLGDVLYGGPARLGPHAVGRPMLHAARLELRHPVTGAPLALEAPWPEDLAALARILGLSLGGERG